MALNTWYLSSDGTMTNDRPYAVNIAYKINSQNQTVSPPTSNVTFRSIVRTRTTSYNWNGTTSAFALTSDTWTYSGSQNLSSDTTTGWTYNTTTLPSIDDTLCDGAACVAAELIYEWTQDITHNSNGTKTVNIAHTYSLNSGGFGPGNVTLNKSIVLDTIPTSSIFSSFNAFDIETTAGAINGNITVYSTSFYHKFILKQSGTQRATWNLTTDPQAATGLRPYSLSLSAGERDAIMAAMPSTDSATFTLELYTYPSATDRTNGTNLIGSMDSETATGTIPSTYKPVLSNVALSGTTVSGSATITMANTSGLVVGMRIYGTGLQVNSYINTITTNTSIVISRTATASGTVTLTSYPAGFPFTNTPAQLLNYIIQNKSSVDLTLAGGVNATGASHANYKIRYDSTVLTGAYTGAKVTRSMGTVTTSGLKTIYYSIQDSRGRWSDEINLSFTVQAYQAPVNNGFDIKRRVGATNRADWTLKFANSLYSIGNTWTYTLEYYTTIWNVAKTATAIAAASIDTIYTADATTYDPALSYPVRVTLIDLMGSSVIFTDNLSTASYPFVLGSTNSAAGKIPSNGTTYDFEVGPNGLISDGDIVIPNTKSYDFAGTTATIRSNGAGAIVVAGTDAYLRPNGDTTTNQLTLTNAGGITHNGNTVWTAGNDGVGSGLDADLLDTYHASNATGSIPISNGTVNTNLNADMIDGLHIEQGSFTPIIQGSTSAGTGTYGHQFGRYTKIGLMVFFELSVNISAHTGTGNIRVGGLPYASNTTAGIIRTFSLEASGLTLTTGHVAYAEMIANVTYIQIVSSLTGTTSLTSVAMDTACTLRISGCYSSSS